MSFAEELVNFRAEHGLTQAQLAEMVDVSPGMVGRWETGKNAPRRTTQIFVTKKMEEYANGK